VTVLAIGELLLFMGILSTHFSWTQFAANGWAGHAQPSIDMLGGLFAAIPFAIWFFLAIEGAAMAAEEARDPTRTIPRAYLGGILTLVLLAFGTMIFAGGVGEWRALANINDPLPQAMKVVVGADSGWLHLLVGIGLLGLVASFHGIIMGYSRQMFALARAGFLPSFLARIHPRFKTPHWAIVAGGIVGILAIYSDDLIQIAGQSLTANLVTLSALGALLLYILSLLSLFRLRRFAPLLPRPFKTPFYPLSPVIALVIALISAAAIIWYNWQITVLFIVTLLIGGVLSLKRLNWRSDDPMLSE